MRLVEVWDRQIVDRKKACMVEYSGRWVEKVVGTYNGSLVASLFLRKIGSAISN